MTGKNWQPIGYSTDSAFTGVFDGNGHAIVGMTCSLQFKYSYNGLFGVTDGAVIKNLEIRDPRFINGGAEDNIVGALVGYAAGNTYIVNCKVPVKFDEQDLSAVGKADNGTLTIAYGKNNQYVVIKLDKEKPVDVTLEKQEDVEIIFGCNQHGVWRNE